MRAALLATAAALGASALIAGACRQTARVDAGVSEADRVPVRHVDESDPFVTNERGLEVRTYVLSDNPAALAAALDEHEDADAGLDPGQRALWEASGLRVMAVPLDGLDAFVRALPVISGERRWMGEAPEWTPLVQGPGLDRPTLVVGGDPVPLGSGRPSLFVRTWTAPDTRPSRYDDLTGSVGARLHVELTPVYENLDRRAELRDVEATLRGRLLALGERGPVFEDLRLGLAADGRHALVVVPEKTGLRWSEVAEEAAESPAPTSRADTGPAGPTPPPDGAEAAQPTPAGARSPGTGVQTSDAGPGDDTAGPVIPRLPTFGESLLIERREMPARGREMPGSARPVVTYRTVLVLLPKAPAGYGLIPD